MEIRIIAENMNGSKRRKMGTCVTDSPDRAIQMYEEDLRDGERITWEYVSPLSNSAAALGRVKSDRKAAASRENGKKGGRPRKFDSMESGFVFCREINAPVTVLIAGEKWKLFPSGKAVKE